MFFTLFFVPFDQTFRVIFEEIIQLRKSLFGNKKIVTFSHIFHAIQKFLNPLIITIDNSPRQRERERARGMRTRKKAKRLNRQKLETKSRKSKKNVSSLILIIYTNLLGGACFVRNYII